MAGSQKCFVCKVLIEPGIAATEIVGGLFDPEDPDFFVVDESVCTVTYAHRDCLISKLQGAQTGDT